MSQLQKIRQRLSQGRSITAVEALNDYGCFRLAARINDLRSEGMNIKTIMIDQDNKRVAKYYEINDVKTC